MELTDRVGVVQTHNKKGEPCGQIITLADMDKDAQELIQEGEKCQAQSTKV